MKRAIRITAILACAALCLLLAARGETQPVAPTTPPAMDGTGAAAVPAVPAPNLNVPFTESLFFSPLELTEIAMAIKGAQTVSEASSPTNQGSVPVIPAHRVISLAGVVYRSEADWIVWLNGQKVTPGRLLPEIVDIQVANDSVRLKWFDIGLNGVISITLRPHQTYDIVTGILLPG
jgi:hypothetical protein